MKYSKKILLACLVLMVSQLLIPEQIDLSKRPLQVERSHNFDVLHYKIKLKFIFEKKSFTGINTVSLKALQDNFAECILNAETFKVTKVTQNQKNLKFKQIPHQLKIFFNKKYNFDEKISFSIHYRSDNIKADPTKFGMGSSYPIGLTFVEKTKSNPDLIQALSFPDGARHWFPCYDHPNDKASQEIIATVPDRFKVLSNGTLISKTTDKGKAVSTYHWMQKNPHPTYLSMLVAGPYHIIKDNLGNLPINYWVYQKDIPLAKIAFHKTPEIIEFFNQEFGYKFPWDKYDQITVPGIGGGAECTSATLIGQSLIHNQKADKDFPSHWLVAHEIAHQWWGDLVTCRDWGHTWINESFGTYFDHIFTKHDLGPEEGALDLLNKKNVYLNEAKNKYMRPIVYHRWNFPGQNFDRHTYQKGAVVIHMMRNLLGEKPFKKTISHFLNKHAFQPADTHDFLTAVKEATGRNFDWFFNQWLLKPGHPIFQISSGWESKTKTINLEIKQIQDTSQGIPIFKVPVNIRIVTPKSDKTHKIWLNKSVEKFTFSSPLPPLMVRFDQGNHLLKEWIFSKSTEELIYQLKHDDPIGRAWAAFELGKIPTEARIVKALKTAAKKDSSWWTKNEATKSLCKLMGKKSLNILKQIARDSHSRVRTQAIHQLGVLEISSVIPFLKTRFQRENSYRVQGEILKAIGLCGDQTDLNFLRSAQKVPSYRNIILRAAKWGIKTIQKKK